MKNNNELMLVGTRIKQNSDGLYSLNDLHRASGGDPKKKPALWLRHENVKELIREVELSSENKGYGNVPLKEAVKTETGRGGGSFAEKELVISYAMWLDPIFHLKVVRSFIESLEKENQVLKLENEAKQHKLDQVTRSDWANRKRVRLYGERDKKNKAINGLLRGLSRSDLSYEEIFRIISYDLNGKSREDFIEFALRNILINKTPDRPIKQSTYTYNPKF